MSNPNLLGTLYKLPGESYHPSVDFSAWLATGDTVASGTVTCTDAAATIGSVAVTTTSVVWELSAGTTKQTSLVTITATTAASDVWTAQLNLVVN